MTDSPQTAVADVPLAASDQRSPASTRTNGSGSGVIARGEREAREAIAAALADLGFSARQVDLRPLPFEGTWGLATSAAYGLANEAVTREMEASGQLTGLSKKEVKALTASAVREWVPVLAEEIAQRVTAAGNPLFGSVEAVNGYVNIAFDSNAVASALIGEVLKRGPEYGKGAPIAPPASSTVLERLLPGRMASAPPPRRGVGRRR